MIDSMHHDRIHPMRSNDSMISIFNAPVREGSSFRALTGLFLPRTIDSFLPSTNATGCRNSSHPSVETPTNHGTGGTNPSIRLKFGGSAPPAIMSTDFSLRLSAKTRIKDLFDAKQTNVQNQLRRHMAKTVPVPTNRGEKNGNKNRTNEQRGARSAPTQDAPLDPLKHSPDSSIDNPADRDEILMMEQHSYNDLAADQDDNLSVRS